MTMPGDVLIELAMRDIDGLRRVVEAVGPDFSASWGGGPRGSLLHQASWFGRADYVALLLDAGATPDGRAETEYATPLGWAAVGSRYSPSHPDDSFSANDGDWVGVAQRLVAAGRARRADVPGHGRGPALGLARGALALRRPSTPAVSGLGLIRGQQRLAVDYCLGDGDELDSRRAGLLTEESEGIGVADLVALHQDAFRAFDDRPPTECALEAVVLVEPAERDVECSLELSRPRRR